VLLVVAVSAALGHHYWAGTLIIGALELVAGVLMLRRGASVVKSPTYPLQASRESLKDTAVWARHAARR
jgi:putative superfamily III holin-X